MSLEVIDDFNDPEIAFGSMSALELRKSYILFKTLSSPLLVKYAPQAVELAFKLRLPIKQVIKKTIFGQFCGGESVSECLPLINQQSDKGIGTILDYASEGGGSGNYDHVLYEVLDSIQAAKNNKKIPFAVFKASGIVNVNILSKRQCDYSGHDEMEFRKFRKRFTTICQAAYDNQVKVMVDAEESWIQDKIDLITEEMMEEYNQSDAIVINTIQLYRKDRYHYLLTQMEKARSKNYKLGVKLVRGAYLEKEAERALKKGYENPLHNNKADCDRDYNKAIKSCLKSLDITFLVVGTHNLNSIELALIEMNNMAINPNDERIFFAQLLGMSDYMTNSLSRKGYRVCKYVPYGPVEKLLPYLTRRAQENSSIAGQSSRELAMLQAEMKRRVSSRL